MANYATKPSNAEYLRKRREADREGHNTSRREWYHANLDKAREIRRKWYHRNRHKLRAAWVKKDAIRRGAAGKHTQEDINRILDAQKHKCAVCRKSIKRGYHIDHIKPLALGGDNFPRNLQVLCPPCNHSKGKKDPNAFMRERGYLL